MDRLSKIKTSRKIFQTLVFGLFKISTAINGIALLIIICFLVKNGWRAINWTFLTQPPMDSMTKGGILPCIVGTIIISLGAIIIALPIGVASAIYLNEYAKPGRIVRMIRLGINNLAGVPSVVFGLFGLAFFVVWHGFGVSILSGALTLAAMTHAPHALLLSRLYMPKKQVATTFLQFTYHVPSLGLKDRASKTIMAVRM